MPYCKVCHNNTLFGSSRVPPAAPTANGPPSGLYGNFSAAGQIVSVTRMGADKDTAKAATAAPQEFFDTCLRCGSHDIQW